MWVKTRLFRRFVGLSLAVGLVAASSSFAAPTAKDPGYEVRVAVAKRVYTPDAFARLKSFQGFTRLDCSPVGPKKMVYRCSFGDAIQGEATVWYRLKLKPAVLVTITRLECSDKLIAAGRCNLP